VPAVARLPLERATTAVAWDSCATTRDPKRVYNLFWYRGLLWSQSCGIELWIGIMDNWGTPVATSIASVALNLVIGLVLSLLVAWYYEAYGQSLANRRTMARLLPALTITTGLVITIVKSSLALSLGLVGALSIVRFRTAIKEPEELLFLFISIAIGLGVGADQRLATIVGVGILLGYMALRMLFQRTSQIHNLYLNLVLTEGERSLFNQVNACLLDHVKTVDFRRLDSREGTLELTYFIDCAKPEAIDALMEDLKRRFSVIEASFLQRDSRLGD